MSELSNPVKLPKEVRIGLHILGWLLNGANLMLPAYFASQNHMPLPPGMDSASLLRNVVAIGSIHLLMQIVVFYANYFFVFDRFFLKNNKSYYFLVSISILLLAWMFENQVFQSGLFGLDPMPHHLRPSGHGGPPGSQPDFLLPLITAYFASFLVKLYPLYIEQQLAQVQLIGQKQQIQLHLLKGQMQPHFLFNTLNNLRYLLRSSPEKADTAILQLSDLLRYTVSSSEQEKVSIAEEAEYLQNYIELQKMRLPKDVEVEVKFHITAPEKQIPPLLLIPFIENAFKYGVSAQYPGFIIIELNATETKFNLMVNNRNYRQKISGSTSVGIPNVKERLSYHYPKQHHLEIINNDNYFTVKLEIQW